MVDYDYPERRNDWQRKGSGPPGRRRDDREYGGRPYDSRNRSPPPRQRQREWQEGPYRPRGPDGDRGQRGRPARDRSHSPRETRKPRAPTPPEVREERAREKELRDMERDTRTVFAYNLNLKADERDIFTFFSTAGTVVDVKIITDRHTRRSKGFAYIELAKQDDVLNALALTGQVLMGQAVMVKASEAEKNLAWEAAQQAQQSQAAAAELSGSAPCKLQVSNLHPNLADQDLKDLFSPFGALESVQITRDANGRSQGHGMVQFKSSSDAGLALKSLHGREIAGLPLKVVVPAGGTDSIYGNGMSELDEDESGGGFKLSSHARAALMSRLASSAGLEARPVVGGPSAQMAGGAGQNSTSLAMTMEQGVLGPSSPIPTPCVLLKNMFNPQDESEPGWDQELAEDVREECSGKYGPVVHVYVDPSSKGFVYLKFESVDAAVKAHSELSRRWFGGRQIMADFQFLQPYSAHFKC